MFTYLTAHKTKEELLRDCVDCYLADVETIDDLRWVISQLQEYESAYRYLEEVEEEEMKESDF